MDDNKLSEEISQQLSLKSEIICVGPPSVVLDGRRVLSLLARLRAVVKAASATIHWESIELLRETNPNHKLVLLADALTALDDADKL